MIEIINLGDITKIKGSEVEITDVVIGGSPCQDLSVAGKRAGLEGERSGLFMEQIRLIKEMRKKDEERSDRKANEPVRPRWMVWENVCGAFSSNGGEDFRAVLEETAKIVDETVVIPRPPKGKWTYSGCILGNDGKWSIAWRVHDAQYFGVPQRRKRISLVADFAGGDAPKVLFVGESVSRHPEQVTEKGKEVAGDTTESTGASSYTLKVRGGVEIDSRGKKAGKGALVQTELSGTLGVSQDQTLITGINGDISGCLDSSYYKGCGERNGVEREVVLGADMYNHSITGDIAVTLNASSGDSPTHSGPSVVYGVTAKGNGDAFLSEEKHTTLSSGGGEPGQGYPTVLLESNQNHATIQTNGVCTSLPAAMGEGGGYIPMVTEPMRGGQQDDVACDTENNQQAVLCIENHPTDSRIKVSETDVVQTLTSRMGTGGMNVPLIAESEQKTFKKKGHAKFKGDGQGWEETDVNDTLNTLDNCENRTPTLIAESDKGEHFKSIESHPKDSRYNLNPTDINQTIPSIMCHDSAHGGLIMENHK